MDTAVPGLPKRYFSRTSRMVRLIAYRIGRIKIGYQVGGEDKKNNCIHRGCERDNVFFWPYPGKIGKDKGSNDTPDEAIRIS